MKQNNRQKKHFRNKPVQIDSIYRLSLNEVVAQKIRNSIGADYRPPDIYRESLGNYRSRNSMNIEMAQHILNQLERPPQTTRTIFNLRNTLSQLEQKLSIAKQELKGKTILTRNIINEEIEEEDNAAFQLNSVIESQIHPKYEESTINIESKTKLLLDIKSKKQLLNFNKIKQYYLTEIVKGIEGENQKALEHLTVSWKIIKTIHKIQCPSREFIEQRKVKLPIHESDMFKKTLVLDLDETLIHCEEEQNDHSDIEVPIEIDHGETAKAYISIRPYAISFLKRMAKHFQIIAFTASHQSYADVVLDEIDPDRQIIKHRLYRENCIQIHHNIYAKDLRIINRDLKNLILVDNAPYSYIYQLENGIPILPYYSGEDQQLPALQKYLIQLSKCDDVRQVNKKTFMLSRYGQFNDPYELTRELYLSNE